jgi:maltoporin
MRTDAAAKLPKNAGASGGKANNSIGDSNEIRKHKAGGIGRSQSTRSSSAGSSESQPVLRRRDGRADHFDVPHHNDQKPHGGQIMHNRFLKTMPAAIALIFTAGHAWASDAEGEFHGYLRTGAGHNSSRGQQACFGLEGVAKYRLGNECDSYGELLYAKELAKSANGVSFVGTFMGTAAAPGYDFGAASPYVSQAYIEAKNVDFLHGGTAWMGKRYYHRPDIHVIDYKWLQSDGVGAGINGFPVGPGKFSYGLFRDDNLIINVKQTSATRHNFTYEGLAVNPNGTLQLDLTLIAKDTKFAGAHGGWSISAVHLQDKALGGDNKFGVQYGVGPGIKIGGTGDIAQGSDVKRTRVFDQLIWQVTPDLCGSLVGLVQWDKSSAGTQTWTSVGVRPVYSLYENFKLQLDVGHDQIRPAAGGSTQQLTKITFAPTLTAGRGFWTRPELRSFITYAKWNTAAQQSASPGSALSSTGVFGGNTNGTSVGVQVEAWF